MSRDRGTTAAAQPEAAADHSNHSTIPADWRRVGAGIGEPYPKEPLPYDELKSKDTRVAISREDRERIRAAVKQLNAIITARVMNADRTQSTATLEGLRLELKEISVARAEGLPEDVRAAFLAAAASMLLLAEMADRPPSQRGYVAVREARKVERRRQKGWQ